MTIEPVYSNRRNQDLAYVRGLDGTPAPDWVKNDPAMMAAYKRGLTKRGGPAGTPTRRAGRSARRLAQQSANSRPAQYAGRGLSPRGAASRLGVPQAAARVGRAGDGGGLLLALVLYPVALATVKYGPTGPLVWFKAKWLNQASGAPAAPGAPAGAPAKPVPMPAPQLPHTHLVPQ
jgi:hypothetical protein